MAPINRSTSLWVVWLVRVLLVLWSGKVPVMEATAINSFRVVLVDDQDSAILREAATGTVIQIHPYVVRLSDNWTVIEKPTNIRKLQGTSDSVGRLLHCRLPLPQEEEAVNAQVRRYIRLNEHRVAAGIWQWLGGVMNGDGCIFGDGEGPVTGVSEWYLFCLRGSVLKVNKTAVISLYGNQTEKRLQQTIRKLVYRARWSSKGSQRSKNFGGWTSRVGEYKSGVTRPRWNARRQLWELIYPTGRACRSWETDAAAYKDRSNVQYEPKEVWETVVRLYCQRAESEKHVLDWSITEVKQTCVHELLMRSPAVCEWDRTLKNFYVNPIPCIAL